MARLADKQEFLSSMCNHFHDTPYTTLLNIRYPISGGNISGKNTGLFRESPLYGLYSLHQFYFFLHIFRISLTLSPCKPLWWNGFTEWTLQIGGGITDEIRLAVSRCFFSGCPLCRQPDFAKVKYGIVTQFFFAFPDRAALARFMKETFP